jgi:hypothetical protein
MKLSLIMASALLTSGATAAIGAQAANTTADQPVAAVPDSANVGYATVQQALAALQAKDDTVVTHADGWTVINEPAANAQWSFPPSSDPAYPALVRRTIKRVPGQGRVVEMSSLCEAPKPACDKLLNDFDASNERMRQYLHSMDSSRNKP